MCLSLDIYEYFKALIISNAIEHILDCQISSKSAVVSQLNMYLGRVCCLPMFINKIIVMYKIY